jgi:hypothetical protein
MKNLSGFGITNTILYGQTKTSYILPANVSLNLHSQSHLPV